MRRIIFESSYQSIWQHLLEGLTFYIRESQADWELHCLTLPEFLAELARRPDGALCVLAPDQPAAIEQVHRSRVPAVNMFRLADQRIPTVTTDNEAVGLRAADYLLSRGFRHFAFLGPDRDWSHRRADGFRRRLAQAGHSFVTPSHPFNIKDYRKLTSPALHRRLRAWLSPLPKPLALFAAADFIARAALHTCHEAGLRVPEDIAILGVDNEIPICELAPVSLSSIPQNLHRIGFEAARLLAGIMAGRRRPARPVLVPPGELVVRRSTDFFAFDDPHVAAALRAIHSAPAADLSMKHVLLTAGVSRQWLDRRFKDLLGKTPSQVIRDIKLERASLLLSTTHLPVREIARRCGFTRAENLTRFFRIATGTSPLGYRLRQQPQFRLSPRGGPPIPS